MHEDNVGQQFSELSGNPNADLPEEHKLILDFEKKWPKHSGAKEVAIRDLFGHSATRYYQKLQTIVKNDAADEYDPATTRRFIARLEAGRLRRKATHDAVEEGRRR